MAVKKTLRTTTCFTDATHLKRRRVVVCAAARARPDIGGARHPLLSAHHPCVLGGRSCSLRPGRPCSRVHVERRHKGRRRRLRLVEVLPKRRGSTRAWGRSRGGRATRGCGVAGRVAAGDRAGCCRGAFISPLLPQEAVLGHQLLNLLLQLADAVVELNLEQLRQRQQLLLVGAKLCLQLVDLPVRVSENLQHPGVHALHSLEGQLRLSGTHVRKQAEILGTTLLVRLRLAKGLKLRIALPQVLLRELELLLHLARRLRHGNPLRADRLVLPLQLVHSLGLLLRLRTLRKHVLHNRGVFGILCLGSGILLTHDVGRPLQLLVATVHSDLRSLDDFLQARDFGALGACVFSELGVGRLKLCPSLRNLFSSLLGSLAACSSVVQRHPQGRQLLSQLLGLVTGHNGLLFDLGPQTHRLLFAGFLEHCDTGNQAFLLFDNSLLGGDLTLKLLLRGGKLCRQRFALLHECRFLLSCFGGLLDKLLLLRLKRSLLGGDLFFELLLCRCEFGSQ
eukprot:Rhum_TRINITY_DN14939_c0_g1::Rhum_TRINITY_DN14939_c0_g1_i3::g.128707::m.128707